MNPTLLLISCKPEYVGYNLLMNLSKYRRFFFFAIIIFVLSATFLAIKFTQGYRIDFVNKTLRPTGLLVAVSNPVGAEVFVNGKLREATNSNLVLSPGEYEIQIKKSGFLPWQKKLQLKKELITETNAFLFPEIPDLKPLTFNGALQPNISPDSSRIVYVVPIPEVKTSTTSATLANLGGVWVMDLTDSFFPLNKEPRQIAKSIAKVRDFGSTELFWSPDSRQILAVFNSGEKILLDASQFNLDSSLINISLTLPNLISGWQTEAKIRELAKLRRLPIPLQEILSQNTKEIEFSPDGTKVSYIATASAEIPENLLPSVLSASTQKQSRQIEPGNLYVYDTKEDRNFLIPFKIPSPTPLIVKKVKLPTPTPIYQILLSSKTTVPQWFPTSRHLFWIEDEKVIVCEYDGTNVTTIYSGPFEKSFVVASSGGNRLIILTKLNSSEEKISNLFSVSLR